jgi:RNA polymerase sigma factor (sigma-70 family)
MVGIDCDDVVQEAYAKLATAERTDHIHNPRAYFFRAAFNVVADEVRRAQVVPIDYMGELDRLEAECTSLSPHVELESRQELRLVAEAIAQLPPQCRAVFNLRKVHGLSQRETAKTLGIAESTVEKHVARGVRHLMELFGRGGKTSAPASRERMPAAGRYGSARTE